MKKKRISISGILIIILTILFVFLLLMGITRLKEEFRGYTKYDEQSFASDLKYQDMYPYCEKQPKMKPRVPNQMKFLKNIMRLGTTMRLLFITKFIDSNYTEKAAAYKAVMDEEEKKMGQLQSEIPDMLEILFNQ